MLAALRSYNYQACNYPDYKDSFAFTLINERIESLTEWLVDRLDIDEMSLRKACTRLPQYWAIEEWNEDFGNEEILPLESSSTFESELANIITWSVDVRDPAGIGIDELDGICQAYHSTRTMFIGC